MPIVQNYDKLPTKHIFPNEELYIKAMELGEIQEGDEIYIEDNEDTQPDYDQNNQDQPDYINNRPFYDTREIARFDSTATPNPASYLIQEFNMTGYKIFDIIPSKEDFLNMEIVMTMGGDSQIITFTERDIKVEWDNGYYIVSDQGVPCSLCQDAGIYTGTFQGVTFTCEVPEAGIYIVAEGAMPAGVTFETVIGGELKTLDKKYLPKGMAYGYESKPFEDIVWDGNTEGLTMASVDVEIQSGVTATYKAYKVSDQIISKSDIIGATVTILRDGSLVERFITDGYVIDGSENGSFFDNYPSVYVVIKDNDVIDMSALVPNLSVTIPEAGIWFAVPEIGGAEYYRTTSLVARTDISKIDSKYLPIGEGNGVAGLDSYGKVPQSQINTVSGVYQNNYNPVTSDAVYIALGNRNQLIFDSTPASGSQNPVTSDGVYWAIENKNVTVDSSVQSGSNNAVSGNAVFNALGGRTQLNFDSVPTSGSSNFVTSGNIYTAIENKKITVDSTVQSSSNNAVSGKAVYSALSNYYTKTEVDNLLGDVDTILDEINALIGE